MDLNAVEMFVIVVQAGSLSAAAVRTGIPLPTLSRRIRALESELAVQLLERSVRGTRLTDAGVRLYEHASRGIEALAEARESVVGAQHELKGFLRLSLPPTFEVWWDLLGEFQARYPGIRLFVHTTERRVDLILDGIDVALRVGAIEQESMVARKIAIYRHRLVASPALLERYGRPETPEDLHRLPCATWGRGAYAPPVWPLGGTKFHPRPVLSTNDYSHLRNRVLVGDVVSELPPFLVTDELRKGRLVSILDDYPFPDVELNLLFPSHRHPSSIVRAYLDFCQAYWDAKLNDFVNDTGSPDSRA
ncbi:LysR family transcriptional regulator [Burkholderia lata]|uniref:LysR family transcriptional regulator n=1 Tax=Burkholderia lata (strain ATCC 17760 / DSM 23089 / LMG 22485 / NCIMB 9086 / R18194 / 383) TaxID=482957 RepID=A0A6P2TZ06_BURL3|nr:LysR family transcriptional regulator [Burkholderia lata]VWC62211.1 LysR family transcriptional regulator [Burkholderia lata]